MAAARWRWCARWIGAAVLFAAPARAAEGDDAVRAAVTALARTSYTWETAARQRFAGETTTPRLEGNAPVEVRGKIDANGTMEVTLGPTRDLAVPVTAVFRMGDVVVQTPLGWLRRAALRQTPNAERSVEFAGKQVRLSRVLGAATKATAMRPLAEDLFDLIAEVKTWRTEQGLVIAELREAAIEQLWGAPDARRAPEIHGTVIFKVGEAGLAEYHVVLGIGFPNSRTKKVAWTMQQWSTRISGIGATAVEPPEAALQALEAER